MAGGQLVRQPARGAPGVPALSIGSLRPARGHLLVHALLALAAVLFVLAVGFILSPAGRPTPPRRRAGGFSRAIADRSDPDGGAQ